MSLKDNVKLPEDFGKISGTDGKLREFDPSMIKILVTIAEALEEGAAGPCHFWYIKLAKRIRDRADRYID